MKILEKKFSYILLSHVFRKILPKTPIRFVKTEFGFALGIEGKIPAEMVETALRQANEMLEKGIKILDMVYESAYGYFSHHKRKDLLHELKKSPEDQFSIIEYSGEIVGFDSELSGEVKHIVFLFQEYLEGESILYFYAARSKKEALEFKGERKALFEKSYRSALQKYIRLQKETLELTPPFYERIYETIKEIHKQIQSENLELVITPKLLNSNISMTILTSSELPYSLYEWPNCHKLHIEIAPEDSKLFSLLSVGQKIFKMLGLCCKWTVSSRFRESSSQIRSILEKAGEEVAVEKQSLLLKASYKDVWGNERVLFTIQQDARKETTPLYIEVLTSIELAIALASEAGGKLL